jgi:hypothetical protein
VAEHLPNEYECLWFTANFFLWMGLHFVANALLSLQRSRAFFQDVATFFSRTEAFASSGQCRTMKMLCHYFLNFSTTAVMLSLPPASFAR